MPAEQSAADAADTVTLVERTPASDGVVTLTFARPDGGRLPDWDPGAHIDVMLGNGTTRQYSLCGDRWDAHTYRVAVLREPASRGGSVYVHDELAVGDVVGSRRPAEQLRAGALGALPVRRRRHRDHAAAADDRPGRARSVRTGSCSTAGGPGRRWRSSTSWPAHGDRVHVVPQDEAGLLDLDAWLGEPRPDTVVYCCGPAPLLDAVGRATAGWAPHRVRTERFVAAEQGAPVRAAPFDVELARTGTTVTVPPHLSVLDGDRCRRRRRRCRRAGRAPAAPARPPCSTACPTTATRSSPTTSAPPGTACSSASHARSPTASCSTSRSPR